MSGHGYDNRHSVLQAAAAELGIATLRSAAGDVPVRPAPQPLVVADYGCSQGQNSLRPMGVAVAALRERTDAPVTVVHTDLPGNDFTALFEALAHDPRSYLATDDDAYGLATGRSFYEEILPPESVSLGWSSVTTHWLSTVPAPVPGHIMAQASGDDGVRRRFADQAGADWRGFLAARANELAPGGRVVMVEPCAHPDGDIGSGRMIDLMDEVLEGLVREGRVDRKAAASATLPVRMRSPDEYEGPVDDHPDLALVSGQVVEDVTTPLWEAFQADGDAAAYAEASVASMRAWSGAMLGEAIDDPATLDLFYERCRARGAADPERLHLRTYHVVLDIAHR